MTGLPLLDPPEPGSAPTIVCPSCSHGIDPHGVDPGRVCGVGDENAVPCACLWSPNDIAADLLQLTRTARVATFESGLEQTAESDRAIDLLLARHTMRTGRELGRTLYVMTGDDPDHDVCIGIVDSPEIASLICYRMNRFYGERDD